MKDPNQMGSLSTDAPDDLRERLWAYEDFSAAEEHPAIDVTGAFASLGFLREALRRRRRLWCATAAIGFVVGCGVYVAYPPAYSASTTLLLTNAAGTDPTTAMETDVALADSQAVASAVVKQLGLAQSPGSLLAAFTATAATDEVLQITVNAPSAADAVQRAKAIGAQFLKFRASLLRTQEQEQATALNQQVTRAEQNLSSLGAQITSLGGTLPVSSTPPSSSSSAPSRVNKLEAKYADANTAVLQLKQQTAGTIAQSQISVIDQIDGSQVLNPATVGKHSKVKNIAYDIVAALFAGLVLGMAFVVLQALISDRLRSRDDIALAIGAPVMLSVGPLKKQRFSISQRARAARRRNQRQIAVYLRKTLQAKSRSASALAVVCLDNAAEVAPGVVEMAKACAQEGMQVVVADLTKGGQVAKMLGTNESGVRLVQVGNAQLVATVPEPDDLAPSGPLRPRGGAALAAPPSEKLLAAYRGADLLLTVAELDPALGGDHLATWATDAVAVVSAGRTPGVRVHALGEMLRLSRVRVISSILVGADQTDETLGVAKPELAQAKT